MVISGKRGRLEQFMKINDKMTPWKTFEMHYKQGQYPMTNTPDSEKKHAASKFRKFQNIQTPHT